MASGTGSTTFEHEGTGPGRAGEVDSTAGRLVAPRATGKERSPADRVARRVLRVREPAAGADVHNIFSSSILLSATRCLLSYIVFPILAPSVQALPVIGPAIGIPVGLLALVFDVKAIRRFFLADHRRRWVAATLYVTVMGMVSYLVARDISRLF